MSIIVNSPETAKKLLDAIKNNKDVLVLYHASGCYHCVEFQPIWESFIKKNAIIGASVESSYSSLLSSEENHNNINSFPTLKLFTNGKVIDFDNERTEKNLEDFVSKNTKSKNSNLTGGAKSKTKNISKSKTNKLKTSKSTTSKLKTIKPKTIKPKTKTLKPKITEKPKAKITKKPKTKTTKKPKTKTVKPNKK